MNCAGAIKSLEDEKCFSYILLQSTNAFLCQKDQVIPWLALAEECQNEICLSAQDGELTRTEGK